MLYDFLINFASINIILNALINNLLLMKNIIRLYFIEYNAYSLDNSYPKKSLINLFTKIIIIRDIYFMQIN